MIENLEAPTPAVEHLTTIFRRVTKGDIRIPAFQRNFVWSEAQVTSLLESVYRGFPIGSLLLWNVKSDILRDAKFPSNPFPEVPVSYPTNYVLDGMQRLSSLYGVFNFKDGVSDSRFNIWFNLEEERFSHESSLSEQGRELSIPLRVLFSPRDLIGEQKRISANLGRPEYLDKTVDLQARFQEYMIPYVTITQNDVSTVVEMFERVNSTGTSLSTVDFMRAVTWSGDFDLNRRLSDINASLEEYSFSVSEQSLIKLIGIELGRDPLPEALLSMRTETAEALNRAIDAVQEKMVEVVMFSRERLRIYGSSYIPYEGQLLVLYTALHSPEGYVSMDDVVRWFWAVSFNESLRGKPDHYVARAVRSVADLVRGRVRGVEPRLEMRPVTLVERRFTQGKALSAGVTGLLAANDARSIQSGEVIRYPAYMLEFSASNFAPLIPLNMLRASLGEKIVSAKLIANVFVTEEEDYEKFRDGEALEIVRSSEWAAVGERLESQFINELAFRHLVNGQFQVFLEARAHAMHRAAEKLVSGEAS